MVVITLTDRPPALRGDLTKWLFEINVGVYVGQVSARVRDELWKRIIDNVKVGRVTMVYQTNNEQRIGFRVHNSHWKPIDFDGLTLMMRPVDESSHLPKRLKPGYSKAARYQTVRSIKAAELRKETEQFQKQQEGSVISDESCAADKLVSTCVKNERLEITKFSKKTEKRLINNNIKIDNDVDMYIDRNDSRTARERTQKKEENKVTDSKSKKQLAKQWTVPDCVIIDLETTGLNEIDDEIIEIGALKIGSGKIEETFHRMIAIEKKLPEFIVKLTGITDSVLAAEGVELSSALVALSEFVGDLPLVAHNILFDMAFLNQAYMLCDMPALKNKTICTLELSRCLLPQVKSHKLRFLIDYFGITCHGEHRSIEDCESVFFLYQKLLAQKLK